MYFQAIYQWRLRRILRRVAASDRERAWLEIKDTWSKAQCLYEGPVTPGATIYIEFALLKHLLTLQDADELLWRGVQSVNKYVCAYSVAGLGRLQSPRLSDLPAEILNRRDVIQRAIGHFWSHVELGIFARLTQDPSRES
jgi:hypothetical protein